MKTTRGLMFSLAGIFLSPYENCDSGEMDEIKIIIAKRLHYALKIEEYRA